MFCVLSLTEVRNLTMKKKGDEDDLMYDIRISTLIETAALQLAEHDTVTAIPTQDAAAAAAATPHSDPSIPGTNICDKICI